MAAPALREFEGATMAREKRNDFPQKIDLEVLNNARIVAAYRRMSVAEYISERLRPLVEGDLAEHQRQGGPVPAAKRRKPATD